MIKFLFWLNYFFNVMLYTWKIIAFMRFREQETISAGYSHDSSHKERKTK